MKKSSKLSKSQFDEIIKQNLIDSGISEQTFTYAIKGRTYPDYYTECEFKKFVSEMKINYTNHYIKFKGNDNAKENKGGAGGELEIKKGRYGLMPPKMASVASSSRFCYIALRDGVDCLCEKNTGMKNQVEFEKECRIFDDGLHAPQLDAYIPNEEYNVYIEAKCHEIFDSHKAEFKNKYRPCFDSNDISYEQALVSDDGETFELSLDLFGIADKKTIRFDIKQFVCHLLGIAKQNKGAKSKLVYLFFKPTVENPEVAKKIDEIFNELKDEIEAIFNSDIIKRFCKRNYIGLVAIAEESKIMQKLESTNLLILLDKTEYMKG